MSNKKTKEQRTEEILDICLECWKGLTPKKRSLTPVAQACGMSKQALYRYFPNKQAIMEALQKRYRSSSHNNRRQIIQIAAQQPTPWNDLTNNTIHFMAANWDLMMMVIHHGLGKPVETIEEVETFYEELNRVNPLGKSQWRWFFNCLISLLWQKQQPYHIDLLKISDKVTEGFAPGVKLSMGEMAAIEKSHLSTIKMDLQDTPVDKALLELMHLNGSGDQSMKELADQAGMGKSSIYNYYNSKEELFQSVFLKIQQSFFTQRAILMQELNTFGEKLYGHILLLSRYLDQVPAVRLMIMEMKKNISLAELREHSKDTEIPLIPMMEEGKDQGFLTTEMLDLSEQLKLISYNLGADCMMNPDRKSPEERAQNIFILFTKGINHAHKMETQKEQPK